MKPEDLAELKDPKNSNRIARWEGIGVEAIEADLATNGGIAYIGPEERHALARKWLEFKKSQPAS